MHDAHDTAAWSITRAEWDGYVADACSSAGKLAWVSTAMTVLGLGVSTAWFLFFKGSIGGNLTTFFVVGIWAVTIRNDIQAFRRMRRTKTALPRVWDANGCVCPICMTECATPCRHGLSRDDQAQLMRYWEAAARRDMGTSLALYSQLLARTPNPNLWQRLQSLQIKLLARAKDSELGLWRRYAAALASGAPWQIPIVLFALFFSPSGSGMSLIMTGMFLGAPLMLMGAKSGRIAQARCTNCRQLLATPHPAQCPECGSSLARTGAIATAEQHGQPGLVLLGLAVMFSTGLLPLIAIHSGALHLLPTPLVLPLVTHGGAFTRNAREALDARTLDSEQASRYADALIDAARPGSGELYFMSDYILGAVQSGVLPESKLDDALRGQVEFAFEIKRTADGAATIVAKPALGAPLFMRTSTVYAVFGGVSFDGGPFVGTSDKPVDRYAFDPIWRNAMRGRTEMPTEFTIPLAPNTRKASWRAWALLVPSGITPDVSYDDNGHLVATDSRVRMIEIGGTIDALTPTAR